MSSSFLSNSSPCTKSELDLFYIPPTNTSIESGGWSQHNPLTALDDTGPIEFYIPASESEYIHLNQTLLYLSVEFNSSLISKSESSNETPIYGPINNLASSLFSQIDVSLKNESIETTNKTYAYKAYITDLLNYGSDSKLTHLQCGLFLKDTSGFMDSIKMDKSNPSAQNHGLLDRRKLIEDSNGTIELVTRLHSDIFNSDRYLINGVDMNIKLMRNSPEFYLMKDENCNVNVKINKAILYIRKAKINSQVLLAHSLALEKATAKYPIKRVVVSSYTIPENVQDFTSPILTSSILPTRVICGMVDNRAFNGNYKLNPFNFTHFNLRQIILNLDSNSIPYKGKGYEFDFKNNKYVRGYFSLFESIDKPVLMNGNDIFRSEYPNGYCLFAFDISPDLCSSEHFNLLKTGKLVLDLSFAENLKKAVSLIVYCEYDNCIEINKTRKILMDYQV